MIVLAIETSCDETAAAVVEETGDPLRPWRLRSSVVASQMALHREWGGIVPELSTATELPDLARLAIVDGDLDAIVAERDAALAKELAPR